MALLEGRAARLVSIAALLVALIAVGITLSVFSAAGDRTIISTEKKPAQPSPDKPYSVTMSPVGTVTFQRPPERIVTQDANYNDMLVAVNRDDKLLATGYQNNFYDGFYRQLPAVDFSLNPKTLIYLSAASGNMFDKELLYQLRADIHHIDPLQLAQSRSWSKADVEEIARNVGPFFANRYSRENIYEGDEPYRFYNVWELADKVAQVYRQPERIAALEKIGDRLTRDIKAKLPPPDKRPKVGLIYYAKGRITPYSLGHGGFGQAQYVAVGALDAFAELKIATYGEGGGRGAALDLEGLLAIDPDVLIMPLAIYGAPGSGQGARAAYEQLLKLGDDPLGKRLKAFQTGRVHPGGTPLQGPVFYLFQIEMAAKQIYPDLFGAYRDDQHYPPEEQLFDRGLVAKILRGEADAGK
jgi:ABC-type Fe3+-hydroxamate transport system substrate-binding protein